MRVADGEGMDLVAAHAQHPRAEAHRFADEGEHTILHDRDGMVAGSGGHRELPTVHPFALVGEQRNAPQPVAAHLGFAPIGIPVPHRHAMGVDGLDHEDAVGADTGRRSHQRRTASGVGTNGPSTTMKSFPRPWTFTKSMTLAPR